MSDRAIHENGISMKLCQMCKSNDSFRKRFLELFKLNDDIDYIDFTGNTETGFGKPDITIHLGNGNYFYIEVKTKWTTGFQENQIKQSAIDTTGYIGLLNYKGQKNEINNSFAFLVDQYHPGCSDGTIKIGKKYSIPVVTWNEVVKICDEISRDEKSNKKDNQKTQIEWFKDDLLNNVDGLDEVSAISFTEDELSMIDHPIKFYKVANILEKLKQINVSKKYFFTKNVDFVLTVNEATNDLPNWGWYIDIKKEKESNKRKHFEYNRLLWVGFNTVLLDDKNIIEMKDYCINDFLFGISVYCDLLSKDKIKNTSYCLDSSGWYYFPLKIDDKKTIQNIFEDIMKQVIDVLGNCIPDNTQSLNSKTLEK